MTSRTYRFWVCILAIGGGVFSPATSFSADYRFFATFFEEDRAAVFSMDTSGTLREGQSYLVGYDPERVAASPNGQLIIVSSSIHPQLSAFFVNRDGSIDPPRGYDPLESNGYDPPVVFHDVLPLAVADFYTTYLPLRIDYPSKSLIASPCFLSVFFSDIKGLNYSGWSNQLYQRNFLPPEGIVGIEMDRGGCLTTSTFTLSLGGDQINSDFVVSPDGRWAVALGISNPKMSICSIHRDGSLELTQQFNYNESTEAINPHAVRFAPDSRRLVMVNEGPHDVISYRLNDETGLWEEADHTTTPHDPPWLWPNEMAISPDGKFIVVLDVYKWPLTTLHVVRLADDGSLTILPDKYLDVIGYPSAMEFIPPWRKGYPDAPNGAMMH